MSLVDTDSFKAAERWLSEFGWDDLDRRGFTQVDIDWFADEPPARPVPTALACVQEALTIALSRYPQLEPLVTVPLGFTDILDLQVPKLGSVLDRDWDYGPGRSVIGLYLVGPEHFASVEAVEEYRRPIDSTGLLAAPFVAYYRCWRHVTGDTIEYDRTIYIRRSLSL